MKAVRYHRPKKVSVDDVEEPTIVHPRDAVLKVTSTAICGSDLHIYNGLLPQVRPFTLGHEFMGIVEEVGPEVTNLQPGDRVVVPFPIAGGQCWFCNHGLQSQCEESNPNYGPEGGLLKEKNTAIFGYTDVYGGYDGGQAEKVRVPFADYGPRKVPDHLTDEQVLFLTDILPTGWQAIEWGNLQGGETVAVFGSGPVGIMAMKSAWVKGASQVIAVDIEDYRLDLARTTANATTVNSNDENAVEFIRELTEGRGADVVVDAVGMEAHRNLLQKASNVVHLQRGSMEVLKNCMSAVRRGGTVSVVGVYGSNYDNFPVHQWFDKEIHLIGGQAIVHKHIDTLLGHIEQGKLRTDDIITHRFSLEEAPHAYEIFNKKEDGCMKVVLTP
ncbi:MAG TPA: zinc-dependent alcohol dehydrogenase [Candidatus Thermoplasmatota archaeon]|nr:zinc-dependent alcohol dehydrogenase [Candidatus Thermoplasmatota archaeon]